MRAEVFIIKANDHLQCQPGSPETRTRPGPGSGLGPADFLSIFTRAGPGPANFILKKSGPGLGLRDQPGFSLNFGQNYDSAMKLLTANIIVDHFGNLFF